MSTRRVLSPIRPWRHLLWLLPLAALLTACAVAPGTGRTIFTGGIDEEDERRIGREQHPRMVKEFGGAYDDPQLQTYISSVGRLLAKTSELPDLNFTFTVLDSPIVNAFALPGGYVYVSRGLLALARNEAEVAGVLAHEIGHVTARHTAERYGQALGATLATVGLAVLAGGQVARAGQSLGALAVRSYNRDQELESDILGIRYLSRAGYDTGAMAGFLNQLQAHSRLEAEIAGNPSAADQFSILQTHPRTAERIAQATRRAAVQPVGDPIVGTAPYRRNIDGLLYGDNPDQGIVKGREFLHPKLRFVFEVPQGFRLKNNANHVLAVGPDETFILFDRATKTYRGRMTNYIREVWAPGEQLNSLERLTVNGMEAATAWLSQRTNQGQQFRRGLAVRYDQDAIYRFLFIARDSAADRYAEKFRDTIRSFRKLSAKEANNIKPLRIALYKVRRGESAQDIAKRLPFDDYRMRRLLVLNGLESASEIKPGQVLKIVRSE